MPRVKKDFTGELVGLDQDSATIEKRASEALANILREIQEVDSERAFDVLAAVAAYHGFALVDLATLRESALGIRIP